MAEDTRGEDNPLWELHEEIPFVLEKAARELYISENQKLVDDGFQTGFVGWFDTTRGVRDSYREKVSQVA